MLTTPQVKLRNVSLTTLPLFDDMGLGAAAGDVDDDGNLDLVVGQGLGRHAEGRGGR